MRIGKRWKQASAVILLLVAEWDVTILTTTLRMASAFAPQLVPPLRCHPACTTRTALRLHRIDFQNSAEFARGEQHLSAVLEEGNVVVYQTGSWFVDGVPVGNESPSWEWCQVDTVQVVWTHNCEHGVIRGIRLQTTKTKKDIIIRPVEPLDFVEFGPEQLVARVPVEWKNNDEGKLLVHVDESMWKESGMM